MRTLVITWTDGTVERVRCDEAKVEAPFLVTSSRGGASLGGRYGYKSWNIAAMREWHFE